MSSVVKSAIIAGTSFSIKEETLPKDSFKVTSLSNRITLVVSKRMSSDLLKIRLCEKSHATNPGLYLLLWVDHFIIDGKVVKSPTTLQWVLIGDALRIWMAASINPNNKLHILEYPVTVNGVTQMKRIIPPQGPKGYTIAYSGDFTA